MKKIAIIGAGGIGSWLAFHLFELQKHEQLFDIGITIFDDDVVEEKNIKYQNFSRVDILDYKVEALSARYGFLGVTERVNNLEKLDQHDCIVCAVDSKEFREKLFNYVELHPDKYWIDLRSEGRSFAYYVKNKENTLQHMLGTLPKEDTGPGSCQLEFELNAGLIQQGNKIVAAMGSQIILNWVRSEYNSPSLVLKV